MTKNDKNIDIFDYDCSENHEKLQKNRKNTKNDKNIDIFEYDCSENHEIMVVLMDFRKVFGAFLGRNFGIGS